MRSRLPGVGPRNLGSVDPDRRERRLALLRVGLLAATLAAVAIVALATGFRPSAGDLRDWGESLGPAGPVLFVPLSVALGCLLFPGRSWRAPPASCSGRQSARRSRCSRRHSRRWPRCSSPGTSQGRASAPCYPSALA